MAKTTHTVSDAAKKYLPETDLPSLKLVGEFADASPAVQLEVLVELRTNAHTSVDETDMSMIVALLALFTAFFATVGLDTVDFSFDHYTGADAFIASLLFFVAAAVVAALIFIPVFLFFLPFQRHAFQARHAAVWLAAYSDELAHRWQAPGRSARRWRRTHSPFARCSP